MDQEGNKINANLSSQNAKAAACTQAVVIAE
jgi:hypothetical protein